MSKSVTPSAPDKIQAYILDHYPLVQKTGLAYDDPLMGFMDSLGILGLIGFLEPEFNIEFSPSDVTEENFASIHSICQLVDHLSQRSK